MSEPAVAPEPTPEPAVAPAPPPPVTPSDWRESLPVDLKTHPALQDTKSVDSLARQYIEQGSLIGRKGIIPPADDSPAERDRYLNELGRPAEPDGYRFASIAREDQPPEVNAFLDRLKPVFHANGATDEQADAITKGYLDIVGERESEKQLANAERAKVTTAALKSEWGMAYDARLEMAQRAGEKVFGKEVLEQFAGATLADGSLVGDHPDFIKNLYENLGSKLSEDEMVAGTSAASSVMSPETAREEIKRLEATAEHNHAYFETNHPEHAAAVKKMQALYAMAYPEEKTA
jgi:hypothetical protein